MSKKVTSAKQAADMSLNGYAQEFDADFNIDVQGKRWKCYSVAIGNREFHCYCDKGSATFVVDTYGDRATFELYDWED